MKIWLRVICSEMNPVCSFMLALFKLRLAGRTDVGGDIVLWCDKSDLHSPFLTHIYTYMHTHTQSTHLCFSHRSEIAPCSPLMRDVGEVVRNGQKRQRNARKGESWPLGLAEASSVSEGAGGWTKWLIHFPGDPLPPSLCTHIHTLSLVDGSSDPGAGFCRDGLHWPRGSPVRVKGHGRILPLSVHVCFWPWRPQAEPQEIWPPLGPAWPLVIFFIFRQQKQIRRKEKLKSAKFRCLGANVPTGLEETKSCQMDLIFMRAWNKGYISSNKVRDISSTFILFGYK